MRFEMLTPVDWLAALIALFAAATMGFAIQRGGTCMVAAVDEAVSERRCSRLLALAECSLWVSGLLALAGLFGATSHYDQGYSAGSAAMAGGVLLGLGALINGACVFGSVARIGAGDWYFLLTPAGFFLGSSMHANLALPAAHASGASAGSHVALGLVVLLLPLLVMRSAGLVAAARQGALPARLWSMHMATVIIGVAFVVLVLAAGPWTYPEALYRTAHTGTLPRPGDLALFAALLGGAIVGGSKKRVPLQWRPAAVVSCLGGGALMGLGSAMIPGGNDNLVLVGIPMLQPYALLAIGAMTLAIATGLIVQGNWRKVLRLPLNGNRMSG